MNVLCKKENSDDNNGRYKKLSCCFLLFLADNTNVLCGFVNVIAYNRQFNNGRFLSSLLVVTSRGQNGHLNVVARNNAKHFNI